MTLYRQLLFLILLMCLLMFAGTITVNLFNVRIFLTEQLEAHAQDTATSLGLSLSPHMAENDKPIMQSMIEAVFDRGYYSEIRLVSVEGDVLVERTAPAALEGVPSWLITLVQLDPPEAGAYVMSGWKLGAVIYVKSHPGYAYRQLWRASVQILGWFVLVALAIGIVAWAGIHALLKPLHAVEKQAEGICAREYNVQGELPRTRELRQVVTAMNRMTAKVKTMLDEQAQSADRMRELAYQDNLTGLGNRRYFDGQLLNLLKSSERASDGALLMVQLQGLQALNNQRGFEAGDAFVKAVAVILSEIAGRHHAIVGRIAGSDFGVLLAQCDGNKMAELCDAILERCSALHDQGIAMTEDVAHIGVATLRGAESAATVLAEADQALRTAQNRGANRWALYAERESTTPAAGRSMWKPRIHSILDTRAIVLHAQPVVAASNPDRQLHQEILVRLPDEDGSLSTAGSILPIVEELGLMRELDRLVIEEIVSYIRSKAERANYAVNVSAESLQDTDFVEWLYAQLEKIPSSQGRLIFELPEFRAVQDLDAVRTLATRLRSLGHGLALDHFGRSFVSFGYLQSLRPDYVKLDGSYTVQVENDRDNQFFVQNLCGIAHSLDIQTIAEQVETQAQWTMLKSLKIDGVQGYVVGRPAPF